MRNFYPYQPNEVKHRKRTTRSQLKVLEDVYKSDTKPNAALRKKLATELQMKPRGVQVRVPAMCVRPNSLTMILVSSSSIFAVLLVLSCGACGC